MKDILKTIESHADFCEVMRIVWTLPDLEIAAALLDGRLLEDAEACAFELGLNASGLREAMRPYTQGGVQELRDELRVEYSRLFCDPVRELVPIFEGSYRHMRDFGEPASMYASKTAIAVSDFMRGCGFVRAGENTEPLDRLTSEFAFFRAMLLRCARAIAEGDSISLAPNAGKSADFARDHLGSWAFDFASSVEAESRCAFYRELAELTAAYSEPFYDLVGKLDRMAIVKEG